MIRLTPLEETVSGQELIKNEYVTVLTTQIQGKFNLTSACSESMHCDLDRLNVETLKVLVRQILHVDTFEELKNWIVEQSIRQTDAIEGIDVDEFNQLIEQFIAREDPNAISWDALDEAAREQLAEMSTTHVELTGSVRNGRIVFDPSPDAPILTHGNELIIGGLHVVVNLREAVV